MKKISFDEILAYLDCPQRWLYQYHYNIDYSISPDELYVDTYNIILKSLFKFNLEKKEFGATEAFELWSDLWPKIGVKAGFDEDTIVRFESQGITSFTNLFTKMAKKINVINVNIPWKSEWKMYNTVIEGSSIALLSGGLTNVKDTDFNIVETFPSYPSIRNAAPAMQVYNISREAFTSEVRSITKMYGFKLQVIDPYTGNTKVLRSKKRNSSIPLLGVLLNQMESKLTLPNYSFHCGRCPYLKACSPNHLSNTSLVNKTATIDDINSIMRNDNEIL